MATLSLTISGAIEFQSNATKDQSCHLVLYTLLDKNKQPIVNSADSCWLKAIAIRPKNTSDLVLPDNCDPFIYNINQQFDINTCLLTGCPVYLGIYVIPCCRIAQDVDSTGWVFGNDTYNLQYESVDLTSNATYCSPAVLGAIDTLDGYAYKIISLSSPQYYRCSRYILNQQNQGILNNIDRIRYATCGLNNSSPAQSLLTYNLPAGLPTHVLNFSVAANTDAYFCFGGIFANQYFTEVNNALNCCDSCTNYSISYTPSFDGNILVIYQDCDSGQIQHITAAITNGTPYTLNNICAVTGSFFAIAYDNTSQAILVAPISGSACRTCPNTYT